MYLGDMGELSRELKRFRQSGGSALLYGGESADALLDSLQDELRCAISDELTRDPEPGEVLILRESLPRGFLGPAQKLMVLTGAELFALAHMLLDGISDGFGFLFCLFDEGLKLSQFADLSLDFVHTHFYILRFFFFERSRWR